MIGPEPADADETTATRSLWAYNIAQRTPQLGSALYRQDDRAIDERSSRSAAQLPSDAAQDYDDSSCVDRGAKPSATSRIPTRARANVILEVAVEAASTAASAVRARLSISTSSCRVRRRAAPPRPPPARLAAGEQEAQVAVALGQRHDRPAAGDRDLQAGDAGHRARGLLAAHLVQHAAPAGSAASSRPRRGRPRPGRRAAGRARGAGSPPPARCPAPKRSAREQRPPIERAASSSSVTRSPSTRSSACTGPSVRPSARRGRGGRARSICSSVAAGLRDGVT